MLKDPTEFRKRFAAWKDGKKPYEAGLPVYRGGKTPHEEFVEQMGPVLYKELLRTNTPNIDTAYDHMLRQLAYESDYGRSRVARQQHNYGGYGWNGKTYTTFKDDEDFVRHYVLLMNERYGAAVNADSVQAYGKALKDKGYYEDTLTNYTRNLVGMKSLSRSAAAHKLSNPNLYQIKPLSLTPVTEQLESTPQFQPVNIVVPEINTDYSLLNASIQSPTPQSINAWKGKGSPAYGGYSLRMPSIREYMLTGNVMPRGFKDGKLPGYLIGKPIIVNGNPTNAKFNDDGTFTDDITKVFDDFYVTPSGVTTKYGSHTDKNWDRYKQLEAFFRTHDQQTGKIKYEPGLEIVSPEFEILQGGGIKQIYDTYRHIPGLKIRPLNLSPNSWIYMSKRQPYNRYPYSASWDDFLTDPKFGKYFAEGGEAEVYESFNNPGYLTKVKLKIPEEGTTLEDLEYAVNRDLKINELPGTEPIIYKGFSTPEIIRRSLNQDTRFVNDEFVPIWELRKLTPTNKVNFKAFNVDPEQIVNDFAGDFGYRYNPDGSWQFGKIKLSDLGINNFAYDTFGNLKFIDPMIQEFKNGKSPIYIKPSHRGRLTALKKRTGKSESELYNDGNPAHKKMVVFARNARKWKH